MFYVTIRLISRNRQMEDRNWLNVKIHKIAKHFLLSLRRLRRRTSESDSWTKTAPSKPLSSFHVASYNHDVILWHMVVMQTTHRTQLRIPSVEMRASLGGDTMDRKRSSKLKLINSRNDFKCTIFKESDV